MLESIKQFYERHLRGFSSSILQLIKVHVIFFVSILIIKSLLIVFGYRNYAELIYDYLILPANWNKFSLRPWTIFTYFFVQQSLSSLLFGMLFMYNFGKIIIQFLGEKKFFTIYMTGNLFGGLMILLIYNFTPSFKGTHGVLLGSMPGIYAVLVGASSFAPNFPVILFLFGSVRLKYIALFFMLFSLLELSNGSTSLGIANLCGSFWGYIYVILLGKGIDLGKPFESFFSILGSTFGFKKKDANGMKVTYRKKDKKKD